MNKTLPKIGKLQIALLGIILAGSPLISQHTQAAAAEAKLEIPATAEAVWQSADKQVQALANAIQTGKLNDVHKYAFAIRDLVAALPERSKNLPLDKAAQVKTNSQFVATLADRLDTTGDANDKAGTEANFKKLQNLLETMRANYR